MSDSKFEYIDDVLLNVDKDKIEKKEKISHQAFSIVDLGCCNPLVWCELY